MKVRLAYKDGASDKVYDIDQSGSEVQIAFGRRGKTLQYQTRTFESTEAAKKFAEKKEKDKRAKGYVDFGSKFDSKRKVSKSAPRKIGDDSYRIMKAKRLNPAKRRMFASGKLNPRDFLVSEKFDGWRAIWNPEVGDFISKGGHRLNAPPSWVKRMRKLEKKFGGDISFDGELYGGRGRLNDTTSSTLQRKNWESESAKEEAWGKLSFVIFDSPTLNENDKSIQKMQRRFSHGKGGKEGFEVMHGENVRLLQKRQIHPNVREQEDFSKLFFVLSQGIQELNLPKTSIPKPIVIGITDEGKPIDATVDDSVFFAPQFGIRDLDQLDEALYQAVAKDAEGFMMRRSDSNFEPTNEAGTKRANSILKVKPKFTEEGLVVAYEEGLGKREGLVGSLIMEKRLEDGKKVRWKLGQGLKDSDTRNPPPIGSVVEYDFRTHSASGKPVDASFKRVRPDLDPKAYARSRQIGGQRFIEGFANADRTYARRIADVVRRRFGRNARVIPKTRGYSVYIGKRRK